ncbi:ABC transporter ATP-binding protein [Arenimonas maotaiensis]|uniref:Probable ATP-binding protein YheS n=1 Tax=Arenimonas maotaiensis TaxID=1446479 RepID=A0A917CG41_9GAMM|nr:ATP-binding cassette domain-containing protein [Arenimonas maotaiensis]GGF86811.1 ABC transporter ATP-binding protein [Arenimonas maotaiensis]
MIAFRNFALRRGERLLLSDIDLTLHSGTRVGVVGRNGCGKSSLFAAILGEVEADRGDIDMPTRLRIASVAQETPSLPDSALDFVLSGDQDVFDVIRAEAAAMDAEDYDAVADAHQKLDELGGYDAPARAGKLLHGLGFSAESHLRPVSDFSGGWRVRLNLARALMKPSDLLLLDEPTNHLDLDAVLWLEQWLLRYPGTILLISHDREFLDGVCTHTLHLNDGRAKLYTGDYTSFERQRAEHLRLQQISFEKEQAEREHLQKFIDRFKAKASKAKQAQSRMKRLAKLAGTEAVRAERAMHIQFGQPAKLPHSLIRLNGADCGYGAGARILEQVGFGLEAGDRVGLLGPNGAGKSTLVKTLVGELPLIDGERVAHPDLRIGYFAQHTVESLTEGQSPMWHLKEIAPDAGEQALRNFLGQWYFVGDRAFESVDGFSGGERARLALALIAYRQPNVLLLDEPTNHLDIDMREALAEALSDFDGAIVLVSHDRHLIGLVSETFWRVADGHVEPFNGDLDEYAVWLKARSTKLDQAASKARSEAKVEAAKPKAAPKSQAELGKLQKQVEKLEKRMAELDSQLAHIQEEMARPELYQSDGGAVLLQLGEQQRKLEAERAGAEADWLAAYEALEQG